MIYKTYAEAKIAKPDCEIVTTGKNWDYEQEIIGTFEARVSGQKDGNHIIGDDAWVICKPADHCSSLKEFLDAGFKFSIDDIYISIDGSVISIDGIYDATNNVHSNDSERYILLASALNGGCKIPAKAEKWTVYTNTLPLCELTDEQAAMLFNAWRGGEIRQALNSYGFCDLPAKATPWFESLVYRIKPKSERELFIENSSRIMHSAEGDGLINDITLGALYDNGLRYKDSTKQSEV